MNSRIANQKTKEDLEGGERSPSDGRDDDNDVKGNGLFKLIGQMINFEKTGE